MLSPSAQRMSIAASPGTGRVLGLREVAAAGLLFLVLTLTLTYPFSLNAHRGVLAQGADDQEVMWIVGWDVHALIHQPLSMFDANILYPEPKTLAYAENLIGSALFAAPIVWLTGNLVLAVNAVALLSCALCGLGAYVLGRRLGMSAGASVCCGLIFAFSPPRFMRTIQIHVGAVQWIPFALAALHRYFDEGRKRDIRLAAAFATLQALTSGHGAVFAGLAITVLVVWRVALGDPLLVVRGLRDLGVPGLLAFVPAVLVFLPYRSLHETLLGGSTLGYWHTTPESFLASPTHLHQAIRPLITGTDVNANASAWLFPGYVPLLLAAVALLWPRAQAPAGDRPARSGPWTRAALLVEAAAAAALAAAVAMSMFAPFRWRISDDLVISARSSARAWFVCLILAVLRLLLRSRVNVTVGDRLRLIREWAASARRDPRMPYAVIAGFCIWVAIAPPNRYWRIGLWRFIYTWPGLNFVRATPRFTVIGLLALAVLAGIGLDRLLGRLDSRRSRIAAAGAGVLLLLEFSMVPLGFTPFRIEFPGTERWLAAQRRPFVVAEVPATVPQTVYMLHSMAHWQKTIHGVARVIPASNQILFEQLANFPSESSVRALQDAGVNFLVVHTDDYPAGERPQLDERLQALAACLKLEYADPAGRVYTLDRSSASREGGCVRR